MLSSKDHSRGSETRDQESLTTCFIQVLWRPKQRIGGVAEWFKATVLKTVDCNRSMSSNPIASAILLHRRARLLAGFVVSGGWGRALHRARRFRIASDRVRIWGNFRARSSVFNGCVLVGGKVLFSCALFADLTGSVHNFHNPYVNSPRYQHTRVPHLLSFCLRKQSIQYT